MRYQNINNNLFIENRKKFIDGSIIRHVEADEIIIPQHPYWKINKHQLKTVKNVELLLKKPCVTYVQIILVMTLNYVLLKRLQTLT